MDANILPILDSGARHNAELGIARLLFGRPVRCLIPYLCECEFAFFKLSRKVWLRVLLDCESAALAEMLSKLWPEGQVVNLFNKPGRSLFVIPVSAEAGGVKQSL